MMGSGVDAGPSRPGNGPATLLSTTSNGNGSIGTDNSWKPISEETPKMNKIRDIVENTISASRRNTVDSILQQINALSPKEMLLLYFKLPIGRNADPDPLKQPLNPLGSRSEVQLTISWIRSHLEVDADISLFKEDVYQEYLQYCENNDIKHLSKADFGKVMKQVFPSVKARRLGQRGDSKYTYSGLTKKSTVNAPMLPDLSESPFDAFGDVDVDKASKNIILEWAEKMGNTKCYSIKDLAVQLINKNAVDTRSESAFTVLAETRPDSSAGKQQLQRKLQEKEHLREQKRKLQENASDLGRIPSDRLKTRRRSGALKSCMSMGTTKNTLSSKISAPVNNPSYPCTKPNGSSCNRNGQSFPKVIKREEDCESTQKGESVGVDRMDTAGDKLKSSLNKGIPKVFEPPTNGNNTVDNALEIHLNEPSFNRDSKLNDSFSSLISSRNKVNKKPSESWTQNFPTHIEDLNNLPDCSEVKANFVQNEFNDEFRTPLSTGDEQNISQLKKFLRENNVVRSSNCIQTPGTLPMNEDFLDFDNGNHITELRRRVSFQNPNTQMSCLGYEQSDSNALATPTDGSETFQFNSIQNPAEVLSQSSSTNPSTFTSPTATPMYRSRNNSGQTSSSYMTPRSTAFTPDLGAQSENYMSFMSPAQTPHTRSRHASCQNFRSASSSVKTRHSSGTPFYRPYVHLNERRNIRSRNSSGNMPQSAPMSPIVQDHQLGNVMHEDFSMQPHESTQMMQKRSMSLLSSFEQRRRHASAGPTIAFHAPIHQPSYFLNSQVTNFHRDPLSLEVTTALSHQQAGINTNQNTNRPNSVPLPQMNPGQEQNLMVKSYPTTPIIGQQFDFRPDCISQQSSYTPTPVPSDYSDFQSCTNLDLNPLLDDTANDPNVSNLSTIDPTLSNPPELSGNLMQHLETSNITFTEAIHPRHATATFVQTSTNNFMQNYSDGTFTNSRTMPQTCDANRNHPILSRSNSIDQDTQRLDQNVGLNVDSQITLNALNATQNLELQFHPPTNLDEDFSHLSGLVDTDELQMVLESHGE